MKPLTPAVWPLLHPPYSSLILFACQLGCKDHVGNSIHSLAKWKITSAFLLSISINGTYTEVQDLMGCIQGLAHLLSKLCAFKPPLYMQHNPSSSPSQPVFPKEIRENDVWLIFRIYFLNPYECSYNKLLLLVFVESKFKLFTFSFKYSMKVFTCADLGLFHRPCIPWYVLHISNNKYCVIH